MTLDEAIKRAEEVAEMKKTLSEESELQGCSMYAIRCGISAEEHRQLAGWLRELRNRRIKQEYMAKDEAMRYVFDELLKCDLFRGIYDASHGDSFINGVRVVMEQIAYMVSEECYSRYIDEFTVNKIKSEDKYSHREEIQEREKR